MEITTTSKKVPILRRLYVQVLIGIAFGVLLGHLWPNVATDMKPLGDGFIKLIKMMLAPIIFATIVIGIARMGNLREVGRVGGKALHCILKCSRRLHCSWA